MSKCCINRDNFGNYIVFLTFYREELLYDIKNYAFVESHVMGEEHQHAQHTLADIGEKGNVDRVTRILALVHATVVEMLYPFTKELPVDDEIDNIMDAPDEYVVEMNIPSTMSQTTVKLLSKLIHEYMVYKVMADWLGITNPPAAPKWEERAMDIEKQILSAKTTHHGVFTRQSSPF